jgi:hypothetical protein
MFSTAPAPRARTLAPDNVLADAERILDRGATLEDAPLLYLAAARREPTGQLRARLRPWAEVWPRLPVRPLGEEATELLLRAVELSTSAALELLDASAVCRAGPQRDDVEARAADLAATRDARGLFHDHHAVLAAAHRDVHEGLQRKQANAAQYAEAALSELIVTLRRAK